MGGVCGLCRSVGLRVITIVPSYARPAVIVRSRASMAISTVLKAVPAANHVHFALRFLAVIGKRIAVEDLVLILDPLKLSLRHAQILFHRLQFEFLLLNSDLESLDFIL